MIHFSSHTNSTFFTDCCGTAILEDEACCPKCRKDIYPKGRKARWDYAMVAFYGRETVNKMRKEARRKDGDI